MLWWIGCVNHRGLGPVDRPGPVSILVVVDWLRQHPTDPTAKVPLGMFQSLLWWIGCVNAESAGTVLDAGGLVSILVVVDWLRQDLDAIVADLPYMRFQSLLWWIGCVNSVSSRSNLLISAGFNPCCGGLAASTSLGAAPGCRADVSILVVVDWLRQRWVSGVTVNAPLGFNPCCGGLAASTIPNPDGKIYRYTLFQSLLWWIGCVNYATVDPRNIEHMFQSLLWWIGCVNPEGRRLCT